MKPKEGFLAAAARHFYRDLSEVEHNDQKSLNALKLAKRCHEMCLWKYFFNLSHLDQNRQKCNSLRPFIPNSRLIHFSVSPHLLRPLKSKRKEIMR